MTEMVAEVYWERGDAAFTDNRYSRSHSWRFDGGQVVPASSSPHVVPLPYSIEANVDPEEAYVAALSSCHMLFYLSLAAAEGLVVESWDAPRDNSRSVPIYRKSTLPNLYPSHRV